MKERPIPFIGPMVRAIREDRKTMTRRVVKGANPYTKSGLLTLIAMGSIKCPYGKVGDRLYVRESARVINVRGGSREIDIVYQADGTFKTVRYPERLAPAPKGKLLANGTYREASRITLEITNVRVERLQDISNEDARDEGIEAFFGGWKNYTDPNVVCQTAKASFRTLWESINGTGSWNANPWVWVVEFRRIEE